MAHDLLSFYHNFVVDRIAVYCVYLVCMYSCIVLYVRVYVAIYSW